MSEQTTEEIDSMNKEWMEYDQTIDYNEDCKPGDNYWVHSISDNPHEYEYCQKCEDFCDKEINSGPYDFETGSDITIGLKHQGYDYQVYLYKLIRVDYGFLEAVDQDPWEIQDEIQEEIQEEIQDHQTLIVEI